MSGSSSGGEAAEGAATLAGRPGLAVCAVAGVMLEGVPLRHVAARFGTPCWVYGGETLRARYRALEAALSPHRVEIFYAAKANDHLAILSLLRAEGAGVDVVSGGEMAKALAAGVPPARMVFSGVGKTAAELRAAMAAGVGQINAESAEEVDMLAALAAERGSRVTVALRINPDVAAGGHAFISTGRAGDKFGIPAAAVLPLYRRVAAAGFLAPGGLAVHIGSQIETMGPFRRAYEVMAGLARAAMAEGLAVPRLDCGGGLGLRASPDAWAGVMAATVAPLGTRLMVEPGRWLVAPCGVLLARVVRVKSGGVRPVVVLDAAMTELIRPALYGARHEIVPLAAGRLHGACVEADIAGPVCESSDMFARARRLPALEEGDVVAILEAGAYGAVMSSTYNARPRAAEVLLWRGGAHLVRARQAVARLWEDETVPDWAAS